MHHISFVSYCKQWTCVVTTPESNPASGQFRGLIRSVAPVVGLIFTSVGSPFRGESTKWSPSDSQDSSMCPSYHPSSGPSRSSLG